MSIPWKTVPLSVVSGCDGLITDGDWIVSKNMDPNGEIRLTQLADIGLGTFLDRSSKFINQDTFEKLNCTALKPKDILISRMADPIGRACIVPKFEYQAITAVDVTILRVDRNFAVPEYVNYICNSKEFLSKAKAAATGTTRGRITRKNLEKIEIPLPPVTEQRRIVEILDQADQLRKLHADADAKSQHILPALFVKMFGDPMTNPQGWEQKTLVQTGSEVRYGLGQPPEKAIDGVPLIRATNIKRGFISKENMVYVNPNSVPSTRNAFLEANEVLVVRSGAYTGDVAQVTEKWKGSVAGYDLVITPSDKLRAEFIESYLLTSYIQKNYFAAHKSRAGQPHLNSSQLENTPFYVPPKEGQDKYKKMVNGLRKLYTKRESSEKQIQKIFQVILYRACTGELTASWREAHMKELLQEMERQSSYLEKKNEG